ncbi:MAG TPA: hypothetical protein PK280_08315 [Planctomycetota bacterium]|nr:hypothetical protein [Planctomycetota bacterium]
MKRLLVTLAVALMALVPATAGLSAEPPPEGGLYETVVRQYLSGQWDPLEELLKARAKEVDALPGAQGADVAYIRQSLAESHPAWWNQIKSGTGKVPFRPTVWGRAVDMTFDPAAKGGVQTTYVGNRAVVTVSWPAADMDNPAHAEHGFSKGELNNLSAFNTLGMAAFWSDLPMASVANLSEDRKTLLIRALEFNANLTGVHLGSPRARHWGLWLYMHSYLGKYAKMPTLNARKAIAAAFLIEVLSNPAKYPSIALPKTLEAENAEEKLALAVHEKIEKGAWTLAEDRAIREAIKALREANPDVLKQGGSVTLPGGLAIDLDPQKDAPLRAKRDAWYKAQFDKTKAG